MLPSGGERTGLHTALGCAAVLIWSTCVGISRSLTEGLGPMTAAAAMLLLGGGLGFAAAAARGGALRRLRDVPRPYLFGCGSLFAVYMLSLYLAIGLAATREEVLVVGIINYLWPGLTLAFSIPLLHKRTGPLFVPGMAAAFAGTVFAAVVPGPATLSRLGAVLAENPAPYALAFVAAVSWGLYSALSARWASRAEGGAVPLFLLVSGALALVLRFVLGEQSHWTGRAVIETIYMAVGPSLIAYAFWDAALRRGRIVPVASFSYLTPLFSTAVSCVYLGIAPGWNLWVACALVIGGAVLCGRSIRDR